MLADRLRDRHEDHAGLLELLLEGGGDRDRIEHRVDRDLAAGPGAAVLAHHAGEHLLLAQRNAELLVGLEDLRVDLVERLRRDLLPRRGVVVDVLVVDLRIVDPRPGRLAHGQPAPVGVETPLQHPGGLVLLLGDEPDGVLGEALRRLVRFDRRLESILVLVDVDKADLLDGLLYGRHSFPPLRFQGPRVGCSAISCARPGSGDHLYRIEVKRQDRLYP